MKYLLDSHILLWSIFQPEILSSKVIEILPLKAIDTKNLLNLPLFDKHKDPFDRMLINQAISNNLILISKDNKFQEYKKFGLELIHY